LLNSNDYSQCSLRIQEAQDVREAEEKLAECEKSLLGQVGKAVEGATGIQTSCAGEKADVERQQSEADAAQERQEQAWPRTSRQL
jgi:hypothetical protein